jgi:hypothetical protein
VCVCVCVPIKDLLFRVFSRKSQASFWRQQLQKNEQK